jgi:hypothetical protein
VTMSDALDLIRLGAKVKQTIDLANVCDVSVAVMTIQDYKGPVKPPQGAQCAIVVFKGDEPLTPLFVRPGAPVEVTELLMEDL